MSKNNQPIGLGDRVRCSISGMTGIVTCITWWLNGCVRLGVNQERVDKDGKPVATEYIDEPQVVLVKASVHKAKVLLVGTSISKGATFGTGGPQRETAGFSR